jgi:hypothetical protein
MLQKDLEIGVEYLRSRKTDFVNNYAKVIAKILTANETLNNAERSFEGLISRLQGRPLDPNRIEAVVANAFAQGQTLEDLVRSSEELLKVFQLIVGAAKPAELEPRIQEGLLNKAKIITERHITNIKLAALKIRAANL